MTEQDFLRLTNEMSPLLDQVLLNICFCDKTGKIIYVNKHAAMNIKALGEHVGFNEIKTGYDVVGTHMSKWHKLKDFTKNLKEKNNMWGTWDIRGVRWRPRSGCIKDDQGEIIGYIGAWEELDGGPNIEDKTEEIFKTSKYHSIK